MDLPVIQIDTVYHVGTMDPADVGRNGGRGGSYEGSALSVSVCPGAWTAIARLGGHAVHELRRPVGAFLDVRAFLADEELREATAEWATAEGMAERRTLWRGWSTDEDGEFRYGLFASRDEAIEELTVDLDEDELEAPEGHDPVEAVETLVATEALLAATGMRLGGSDDATDACVMAYATTVLRGAGLALDGLWWNEEHDPDALSAPRGCVFADRVGAWRASALDPRRVPDDEALLDAFPPAGRRTVDIPSPPAGQTP